MAVLRIEPYWDGATGFAELNRGDIISSFDVRDETPVGERTIECPVEVVSEVVAGFAK